MYSDFIVKYLKNGEWCYESGFDLWERAFEWISEQIDNDYSITKWKIIEIE